jgi:GTP-binding protein HflX
MRELDGSTTGLKTSQVHRLEATFRRKVTGDELVSGELARHLVELSQELHRQVGVLVDRGGNVQHVIVGEPSRLYLPDVGRARAGSYRLRGLRLIRTELRGQGLTREDLADLSKLRLDAVVVIETEALAGGPRAVHFAYLVPDGATRTVTPTKESYSNLRELPPEAMGLIRDAESEMGRLFARDAKALVRDLAVVVSVHASGRGARTRAEQSVAEMEELARTAGVEVIDTVIQIRREIDPKTVLGQGKIEEITLRALELGAELLIFDRDLSPSQLRAITNSTDLKVLDRTMLILDIFARRAKSRDGKLQVELAQLKYALPRLVEKSTAMSRLTGGIGGQGPGETKLEIHRRRARDRINRLEKQIEQLSVQRNVRRKRRRSARIPQLAIVGYTNAGKSTLLNALTRSDVLAEDKLFATLDPTSRRVRFPSDHELVLTDTVGFIRDLPKDLVNAFKATLEELEEADLVLHVMDAADTLFDEKRKAVEAILAELGIDDIPRLVVLNKIDLANRLLVTAQRRATDGVPVSATTREGLPELITRVETEVFQARGGLANAQGLEPEDGLTFLGADEWVE